MKILRHMMPGQACAPAFSSSSSSSPASLSIAAMAVSLGLSACGGGGSDNNTPPATGGNATPSGAASVSLSATSPAEFAWRIETAASVVLKDGKGATVPANAVSCAPQDAAQVQVKPDCSSIRALRLGDLAIVVSGNGSSATLTVKGIPQRTWTGVHGSDRTSGGYAMVPMADGRLLAWGYNQFGLLGQNRGQGGPGTGQPAFPSLAVPTPVLDAAGTGPLRDIVQASCGEETSLALAKDGTLWSWGKNNNWDLGRNEAQYVNGSLLPVRVTSLNNRGTLDHVVQAEVGDGREVALLDDGTVVAWGSYPGDGHVDGNGDPVSRSLPTKVLSPDSDAPLSGIVAVSAGHSVSVALAADGRVYSWGFDLGQGRLGMGVIPKTGGQISAKSVHVKKSDGTDLDNIIQISSGYNMTLALAADGTVWAWGANDHGQLGQNTMASGTDSPKAVQVKAPKGMAGVLNHIVMVSAGGRTGQALTDDGRIYTWGIGTSGQLGDGPNRLAGQVALQPVLVTDTSGAAPLNNAVSIAAGYDHALALLADGSVVSWGANFGSALGRPTTALEDATPGRVDMGGGAFLTLNLSAYPNLKARAR